MRPIAIVFLLALFGCDRETRQQSAVREVATLDQSATSTAAVEVRETRGPVDTTTTVEEYAPAASVTPTPETGNSLREPLPARGVTETPGGMAPAGSRLVRRTVTVEHAAPVVTDTHAVAATATQAHAAAERDATAKTDKETHLGPPWWVWPACVVAALVALALIYRFRAVLL